MLYFFSPFLFDSFIIPKSTPWHFPNNGISFSKLYPCSAVYIFDCKYTLFQDGSAQEGRLWGHAMGGNQAQSSGALPKGSRRPFPIARFLGRRGEAVAITAPSPETVHYGRHVKVKEEPGVRKGPRVVGKCLTVFSSVRLSRRDPTMPIKETAKIVRPRRMRMTAGARKSPSRVRCFCLSTSA